MFELRIVGETPTALLQNMQEAMATFAATVTPPTAPGVVEDKFPASDNVGAEPMENPKVGGKGKLGRKPKPQTIEAKANETTAATDLGKADFLDDAPAEKPAAKPNADVTVEQVKDTVRAVLDSFTARAQAAIPGFDKLKGDALEAANKEIMANKVAYAKRLLESFEAQKVTDLQPHQYADFVEAAQAYISGEA